MPVFDKTGPQGQGPMTGRNMGPCALRQNIKMGIGYRRLGIGYGRCCGYGRGLGRYFGINTPQTKEEKLSDITDYKKALQEELEELEKELASLQ